MPCMAAENHVRLYAIWLGGECAELWRPHVSLERRVWGKSRSTHHTINSTELPRKLVTFICRWAATSRTLEVSMVMLHTYLYQCN